MSTGQHDKTIYRLIIYLMCWFLEIIFLAQKQTVVNKTIQIYNGIQKHESTNENAIILQLYCMELNGHKFADTFDDL